MRLNTVMIINAILAVVFGIVFVLIPAQAVSLYGTAPDAPLNYTIQLLGAAFLGFAVLTWSARNATDSQARKAIVLALFVGNCVGFIIALIGQIRNVVNAVGWLTVAIYLLLALGFGYFQFVKPAAEETSTVAE